MKEHGTWWCPSWPVWIYVSGQSSRSAPMMHVCLTAAWSACPGGKYNRGRSGPSPLLRLPLPLSDKTTGPHFDLWGSQDVVWKLCVRDLLSWISHFYLRSRDILSLNLHIHVPLWHCMDGMFCGLTQVKYEPQRNFLFKKKNIVWFDLTTSWKSDRKLEKTSVQKQHTWGNPIGQRAKLRVCVISISSIHN